MEVTGHLNVHAVLTPRKAVPLHTQYEAVCVPEPVWMCSELEGSLASLEKWPTLSWFSSMLLNVLLSADGK
jgi:hypothetical protein